MYLNITLEQMITTAKYILENYSYAFVLAATILAAVLTVRYMAKHMPTSGKITEVYNERGEKMEQKISKKVKVFVPAACVVLVLVLFYCLLRGGLLAGFE